MIKLQRETIIKYQRKSRNYYSAAFFFSLLPKKVPKFRISGKDRDIEESILVV